MRLLSQKHSEYKGKKYHKFWVVIPNKIIDQLGWKSGEELGVDIKENKLLIKNDSK